MPSVTFTGNVVIAGVRINYTLTRDAPGVIGQQTTLDPAVSGQLTTRTDADTGVLTVASGHGITNGTGNYAVFFDGGLRRSVNTVVTNTTVSIDGGTGDDLPVVNTNCTIGPQVSLNTDFNGDDVTMFAVSAQRRASVVFAQDDGTSIFLLDLGLSGTDGEGFTYSDDGPITNPLVNTVVGQLIVANGSTNVNGNRISAGIQYNSEE